MGRLTRAKQAQTRRRCGVQEVARQWAGGKQSYGGNAVQNFRLVFILLLLSLTLSLLRCLQYILFWLFVLCFFYLLLSLRSCPSPKSSIQGNPVISNHPTEPQCQQPLHYRPKQPRLSGSAHAQTLNPKSACLRGPKSHQSSLPQGKINWAQILFYLYRICVQLQAVWTCELYTSSALLYKTNTVYTLVRSIRILYQRFCALPVLNLPSCTTAPRMNWFWADSIWDPGPSIFMMKGLLAHLGRMLCDKFNNHRNWHIHKKCSRMYNSSWLRTWSVYSQHELTWLVHKKTTPIPHLCSQWLLERLHT
jgi:hypothetical protein